MYKKILAYLLPIFFILAIYSFSQITVSQPGGDDTYTITNNPDEVTIEVTAEELGVVDNSLDSIFLSRAVNKRINFSSVNDDNQYGFRKTVDFDGLKEAVYAGADTTVSGTIYGEPGKTESISNETPIMVTSNTHIILPKSYKMDFALTEGTADTQGVFRLRNASNVLIEGGNFDGNAANNGIMTEHVHAINITGCDNVTIKDAYIHDWAGDGIYIVNSSNIRIINCYISQPNVNAVAPLIGRNCISIVNAAITGDGAGYEGGTDSLLSNIIISGNLLFDGEPAAIDIEPNVEGMIDNTIISGNYFYSTTYNYGRGVALVGGNTCPIRRTIINDNIFRRKIYAVEIGGTSGISETKIVDNVIDSTGSSGIYIHNADAIEVLGNTVSNSGEFGIYAVTTSYDLNIQDNRVYNTQKDGIYIYDVDSLVTISDNTSYNNGLKTSDTYYGINVTSTPRVNVFNNRCYDDQATPYQKGGIVINDCDSVFVHGNTLWGNKTYNTTYFYSVDYYGEGLNYYDYTLDYGDVGDNFINKDGSVKMDSCWYILTSVTPGDTLPAFHETMVEGEVTATHLTPQANDRGFLRFSAGGGIDSVSKSGIDIMGYSAESGHSNIVRVFTNGVEAFRADANGVEFRRGTIETIGTVNFYTDTSIVSDAYGITSEIITAYANGLEVTFEAGVANTTTCYLQINGLGNKEIVKAFDATLETGDINVGQFVTCMYDVSAGKWQMTSQLGQ